MTRDHYSKKQLEKEFGVKQTFEFTTSDSLGKKHIRVKYYVEIDPATGEKTMNLYDAEIESWWEK